MITKVLEKNTGIIDLEIMVDEFSNLIKLKNGKKALKGSKSDFDAIKSIIVNNKKIGSEVYNYKDFIEILNITEDDLKHESILISDLKLINNKKTEVNYVMAALRKHTIASCYGDILKCISKGKSIKECIEYCLELFDTDISATLSLTLLLYAEFNDITSVNDLYYINRIYSKFLEKRDQFKNDRNLKLQEKLEKKINALEIENEGDRNFKKENQNKLRDIQKKYNHLSENHTKLTKSFSIIESKISNEVKMSNKMKEEIAEIIAKEKNEVLQKTLENNIKNLTESLTEEKLKNDRLENRIIELTQELTELKLKGEHTIGVGCFEDEVAAENFEEETRAEEQRYFANINIKNGKHFINCNGIDSILEVNDDDKYYANGEIVIIDGNKNIISFTDCYNDRDMNALKYGFIRNADNDKYYIEDAYGNKLFKVDGGKSLATANVVAYNSNREIKVKFRRIKENIDLYKDSIEAKAHNAYIIINKFENNLILRDAITDKVLVVRESELKGLKHYKLEQSYMILLNKDNYLKGVISNNYYYALSKNYDKKELVIIEYIDGIIYGLKQNGERVKLCISTVMSDELEEGSIVVIDEFNNALYKEEYEEIDLREKRIFEGRINNSTGISEKIETTDEICVVGRECYKKNYQRAFLKNGIKLNFVDGHLSYSKVYQVIKGASKIIICTTGVSHGNMWRIKEDFSDVNVIYTDNDGANRLYEEYLEKLCD